MASITAVGCYIFAGGFTVGVGKHFKILAHLEDGDFGVATARLNWPKLSIHTDPGTWPLADLRKKGVDFIYCNPPCAPWSATGRSNQLGYDQWKTDPRVDCVRKAFGVLETVQPTVWVWESVPRAYTAGRELVDALTKRAQKLGYSVTYFLTDAQLHGLPQRRQRFHFIAHKVALDFTEPTGKITTVRDALKGVKSKWSPAGDERWKKIARRTKPGDGMREAYDELYPKPTLNSRGQALGRPTWMNFRLEWNKPSPTLIGAAHALHPTAHRIIGPEEQAALCGYPRDFKWAGGRSKLYPQICRAVTPVIGNYLGGVVAHGVKRDRRLGRSTVSVVDFRKLTRITEGTR